MKQRILTLLLAAGCLVVGAIGVFLYISQDHTAPEIKVEKKKITYTEGDSYDELMKGISAHDNIDGDISDDIFIDKIVPMEDGRAVVYYGVMDKHHNVGTAKRTVDYTAKDDGTEESEPEESEENPESVPETAEGEMESGEDIPLEPNGANPVMALTASEMTMNAGEMFDVLSVVKDVADDKDDKNTLYQHISAEGEYDTTVPGVYEIRYFVSDSDGNTSEPHVFTLTVQ